MPEVECANIGARVQIRRAPRIHIAINRRQDCTNRAAAFAEILSGANDGVICRWLVSSIARTGCALRCGIEHANRETARKSTEQLAGAEDSYRLEGDGVPVDASERWCSSDAPAVIESFAAAVDRVAVDVEAEQAASGDEERTSLVEERLVGGEIEHRRIGLDLSEIRVYSRIERQIGSEAVLHVATGSHVRSLSEGVVDDF